MSITIGSIYTGSFYAAGLEGPSRLNLYSPTNSQLVVLKSGLPDVYIQMDRFAFGRCNNFFHITDTNCNTTLVRFENGSNQVRYFTSFQEGVTIGSNLTVGSNLSAGLISGSNLVLRFNSPINGLGASNRALLVTNGSTQNNLFYVNADGTSYLRGPVGIATSNLLANQALTISGNCSATGQITSSNVRTQVMTFFNNSTTTSVVFRNNGVAFLGNVEIMGSFSASNFNMGSNVSYTNFTAQDYIQSPQLILTDFVDGPKIPLSILQNTASYTQNTVQVQLTPPSSLRTGSDFYSSATSNYYQALTINNTGLVGIGTATPQSVLDVWGDYAYYVNSNTNLVSVRSPYTSNTLHVTPQAYLGIGTTTPLSELHIVRASSNLVAPASSPLVTLNNGAFAMANLLIAQSNQVPVLGAAANGALGLGPAAAGGIAQGALPNGFFLDVDGSARFSNIQAQMLTGSNGLLSLSSNTTLNVPFQILTSNLLATVLAGCNVTTCNLVACNLVTPLLSTDIFNNRLQVQATNTQFTGTQVCLSSTAADIDTSATAISTAGKLKIIVPTSAVANFPIAGMGIYGPGDNSTMVRSSTGIAYYEFQGSSNSTTNIGRLGMDTSGRIQLAIRSANPGDGALNKTAPVLTMNPTVTYNPITLNNYVSMTDTIFNRTGGGLGVGVYRTSGNTTPLYNLDMVGGVLGIRPDTGFPSSVNPNLTSFFVDANAGQVAIGTSTVPGAYQFYALRTHAYVHSNLTVTSNITTSNLNFTGDLFRDGVLYTPSQWTTSNVNIYILGSNVGIGTATPQYELHVEGNIYSSQDVIAASDSNLKSNLSPIGDALQKVSSLTGYTYVRRDDPTQKRMAGLLAQDVQRVLPEAVYQDRGSQTLSLAYGNLSALVIEAIKDLKKKNEELEARIALLEEAYASPCTRS